MAVLIFDGAPVREGAVDAPGGDDGKLQLEFDNGLDDQFLLPGIEKRGFGLGEAMNLRLSFAVITGTGGF